VLGYDYKEKKYQVVVHHSGQEKLVTRLSLLFLAEDPELFRKRVTHCKDMQAVVEAELRFTNFVDQVPADQVSVLQRERRLNFLGRCVRETDKFDPDKVHAIFKHLMRVVEEEYVRQMKKCVVLREMQDPATHSKFQAMKIPVRIQRRTAPYFGVVRTPQYKFPAFFEEIIRRHWSSDGDLVTMTKIFTKKCIDFQGSRFMNTNKHQLKLPKELKELRKLQESHHQSVTQNILIQWREYLISEIVDKLKKNHHFFETNIDLFEASPLKKIIIRFEFILNSYVREFVRLSVEDWVSFIRSFTHPKYDKGELWKISNTPFLDIKLSFSLAKKRKEAEKKAAEKKKKKESK